MFKLCRNCIYSVKANRVLMCVNPKVYKEALFVPMDVGVPCSKERTKSWFAACGKAGKLHE